jgi:glycerol uptake operon antiterminator
MSNNPAREKFFASISEIPIVASVKDEDSLQAALRSECEIIFVLYGDLCSIGQIVQQIKDTGKTAIVHIDLIDGLSSREIAVKYLRENSSADGIISTRPGMIKAAREQNLLAIQRYFLIDSIALENFKKSVGSGCADAIEVLPAVMPKVIKHILSFCPIPLIIGGLIMDKEDIIAGLESGAVAVSSTNPDIWTML